MRTIPDYPKPGIMFRDITTLLGHANGLRACIERLVAPFSPAGASRSVAGIEARGFILGGAVADQLALRLRADPQEGQAPTRRPSARSTSWKYGIDIIEIHEDALKPGEPVLLVDDLIATGGTAEAAVKLLRKLNAERGGCRLRHRFARSHGGSTRLAKLGIRVPHADGLRRGLTPGPANIDGKHYRATIWLNPDGWSVGIIDQTRLPHRLRDRHARDARRTRRGRSPPCRCAARR